MTYDLLGVGLVMVISALAQVAGHYFNWNDLLGKPLPRLGAYTYGMAMIAIPLVAYFVLSSNYLAALALVGTVTSAGLAVIGCYALDDYLRIKRRLIETEQREVALRKNLIDDQRTTESLS